MFYSLVAGFVLGVAVQTIYTVSWQWWWLLAALCSIFLVGAARIQSHGSRVRQYLLGVGVVGFAILLGVARLDLAADRFATDAYDEQLDEVTTIVGVVSAEPDVRTSQQMLQVTVPDTTVLVSADRQYVVGYGDLVEATGVLERPGEFTTEFGRTFDYAGHLQAQGIAYRMSFAELAVVDTGHGNWFLTGLLDFKQSFMRTVAALIPEPAAGLSAGLLLGVKQALGADLETAFRKTGIIHIVVLSGYNVMLVVAFVTTILGYFLSLRARVLTGLVAITAFALMVGLSATVVRASVMAGLFLFAQVIGRNYQVLRALFLAGFSMVVLNPFIVVYDIGFQLSFMATLGLLLVAPRFELLLMQVPQWLGIRNFFVATVATQIAVLPILLYQIGEISVVSVPVNMLVLPMVPVAMLGTFIVGIVGFVSTELALWLAYTTYLSLQYIIVLAEYFAAVPFAAFWVPVFSFWWVLLGYGLLVVVFYRWFRPSTEMVAKPPVPQPVAQYKPSSSMATWIIEDESVGRT